MGSITTLTNTTSTKRDPVYKTLRTDLAGSKFFINSSHYYFDPNFVQMFYRVSLLHHILLLFYFGPPITTVCSMKFNLYVPFLLL